MRSGFPKYTLKMRGDAIRVIQEGYPEAVFDREGLWAEYRRVSFPNKEDPTRRYVIERAIDTLEGKSPQMYQGRIKEGKVSGRWVDRWAPALIGRSLPVSAPGKPRKRRPILLRILERIRSL